MKYIRVLFLCILLFLVGCEKNTIDETLSFSEFDFAAVDQIRLQNAHNGEETIISDPAAILEIVSFVQSVSGSNPTSSKGYYEASYAFSFYQNDSVVFSMCFGDSDIFNYGEYEDGYPVRYTLDDMTIRGDVIPFFSQYDESGFSWK